jgi:hypothetical protein
MDLVEVWALFLLPNLTPVPSGSVRFRASRSAIASLPPASMVTTGPVDAVVQDGMFVVLLMASDDPGWRTGGVPVPYDIEIRVDGYRESFCALLPSPGPHNLADLVHLT